MMSCTVHPFDFDRNLFNFLFVSFFFLVKCSSISCMYGEVFVSTISLVFLLLMAFLKLVAKIVKLYVSGLPI